MIIRFYGYGNPLSLKRLTDEKLIKLRGQVQTDFVAKYEKISTDERHKEWFFGKIENLKEFDFNHGDRDLIDVIVNHIRTIGVDDKVIAKHYKDIKNLKSKKKFSGNQIFETEFGQAYGNNVEEHDNKLPDEGMTDLRDILFNKANIMFEKYESDDFQKKRVFNNEMVKISDVNSEKGTALGIVLCCFCEENAPKSDVRVYCKSIASGSWTLSNITTHMTRQHNAEIPRSKQLPSPKKKKTQSNDTSLDSTDEESLKQIVIDQISDQMKKIGESMNLKKDKDNFKVVTTPRESHCVFTSLCHQLFHKLTVGMVPKLRKDVVLHITQNIERYEPMIQKRIGEMKIAPRKKSKITPRIYLEKYLSKPTTFAGTETFLAVKELYNVNIVTLDDEGSLVAPACFNRTIDRTLLICSIDEFYHKSVVYISTDMIETISDSIVSLFLKRQNDSVE